MPASFGLTGRSNECRTCECEKSRKTKAGYDYLAAATKECSSCHETLPSSCFRRDRTNSTSLNSVCKSYRPEQERRGAASRRSVPLLEAALPASKT